MTVAFVVINTEPGREHDVYRALRGLPDVGELHPLFGEYDLIVKLEAPDFDALGQVIVSKIRTVPGVVSTKTFAGAKW